MMEWIPKGLPNIHAPVPVCGKREEEVHTLGEGVLRMGPLVGRTRKEDELCPI